MQVRFCDKEFAKLKDMLICYEWAHRDMLTKLGIMHEAHKHYQNSETIGYIAGRIKSPERIAAKLQRQGFALTAANARNHLYDIAGIRIICSYATDIYFFANLIRTMPGCGVIGEKDYVSNPKPSGYRSYHMIMEAPIYHSGRTETYPIEIQIRTEAMNFWATLEHQARYRYQNQIPRHLSDELIACADHIAELDNRMFQIQENVSRLKDGLV